MLTNKNLKDESKISDEYKYIKNFTVGSYIDCLDQKEWRVAQIKATNETAIDIHYEAWALKYDESAIPKTISRLAPFRSHTVGYTGQTKEPYRDFKYLNSEKQALENQMKEISDSQFKISLSAYEITQLIRGKLFIYADTLLTSVKYYRPNIKDWEEILEFFDKIFEFILQWLVAYPKFKTESEASITNKYLYMEDPQVALSSCFPEFFEILKLCFGINPNRLNNTIQYLDSLVSPCTIASFVMQLSEVFKKRKGLDIFSSIISARNEQNGNYIYPVILICKMLECVDRLLSIYANNKEIEQFIINAGQSIILRFSQFNLKDMKEIEEIGEQKFLSTLDIVLRKTKEGVFPIKKSFQRNGYVSYLHSNDIKKRKFGLMKFKESSELSLILKDLMTENKKEYSSKTNVVIKEIQDSKIIDIIFSYDPHPELIMFSYDIVKLLIKKSSLAKEQQAAIWNCYLKNSNEVKAAILRLIADVAAYAPYPVIETFFKSFKEIPFKDYIEGTFVFLRDYSINIKRNVVKQTQINQKILAALKKENDKKQGKDLIKVEINQELDEDRFQLYDFNIFWEYFTSNADQGLNPKNKDFAVECLIKAIYEDPVLIQDYMITALRAITQGKPYIFRAMAFFKKMFSTLVKKESSINWLKVANKEQDFFEKAFQNLVKYKKEVNAICAKDPSIKNIMRKEFVPEFAHEDCIRIYFDFFEFLIENLPNDIALKESHLSELWSLFVLSATCEEEKNTFFIYLMRYKEEPKTKKKIYSIINDANCLHLFFSYFVNPAKFKFELVNVISFNCYKYYLERSNVIRKAMKIEKDQYIILNQELNGFLELWQIAFRSQDKDARLMSARLIIDLYIALTRDKPTKIASVAGSITKYAADQANAEPKTKQKIFDYINIVQSFLDGFEGRQHAKIDKNLYKVEPTAIIKCLVKQHDGTLVKELKIKISENQTINDLKNAISFKMKLGRSRFKLFTREGNQLVDDSYNSVYIKKANVEFIVDLELLRILETDLPSYVLPNNDKVLQDLFDYMEVDEECAKLIWKMIKTFSLNNSIVEKFLNLYLEVKGNACNFWLEYLQIVFKVPQLLYAFYTLRRLLSRKETKFSLPPDYRLLFLKKKGADFLLYCYNNYCTFFTFNYSHLRLLKNLQACLTILLKLCRDSKSNEWVEMFFQSDDEKKELLVVTLDFLGKFSVLSNEYRQAIKDEDLKQCLYKTIKSTLMLILEFGNVIGEASIPMYDANNLFYNTLIQYFTKCQDSKLMSAISKVIRKYIKRVDLNKAICKNLFLVILYRIIDDPNILPQLTKYYFELIHQALEITPQQVIDVEELKEKQIMNKISNIICSFENYPGVNFRGLITILDILYKKNAKFASETLTQSDPLVEALSLFVFPTNLQLSEIKQKHLNELCRDPLIPRISLNLLKSICMERQTYIFYLASKFAPLFEQLSLWRTSKEEDWSIVVRGVEEFQPTSFVGLENPGNICYLNSFLQQMFFTSAFRNLILGLNNTSVYIKDKQRDLLQQIKIIFGTLHKHSCNSYCASHLCNIISDFEGKPLSINEQKDIDEFLNLFFDRLENNLKDTKEPSLIQDNFGGCFANEIICLECPHASENTENFLSLNLQIQNKRKLTESLNAFIESESLEGNNAYNCETCGRKIKAKRRTTFKILPNTLIIVLKRFEYDYEKCVKKKLNDYYEFPLDLNMEQYTKEYHTRKDIQGNPENNEENIMQMNEDEALPKDYYEYKLKGVVLHCGTAESGHYTSLICDRENNKWYEFNDVRVNEFNVSQLGDEAFGGQEEGKGILASYNSKHEMFTKIKNAYLLFYERKGYYNIQLIKELNSELKDKPDLNDFASRFSLAKVDPSIIATPKINEDTEKLIQEESEKVKARKTILNNDFIRFVSDLIIKYHQKQLNDYEIIEKFALQGNLRNQVSLPQQLTDYLDTFETWKFLCRFIFTALLRIKQDSKGPSLTVLRALKNAMRYDLCLCIWILETLTHPCILFEFFFSCPLPFPRFFASSIILTACKMVFSKGEKGKISKLNANSESFIKFILEKGEKGKDEQGNSVYNIIESDHQIPLILILIHNVMSLIPSVLDNHDRLKDITFLLTMIGRIDPSLKKFMLNYKLIGVCFEKILSRPGTCTAELRNAIQIVINKSQYDFGFQKCEQPGENTRAENSGRPSLTGNTNKALQKSRKHLRYLLDLVSELLIECQLMNFAPSPNNLQHNLSQDEVALFSELFKTETYSKLFALANNNIAKYAISRMLCKANNGNQILSTNIIEYLLKRFMASEVNQLATYTYVLENIMMLNDKCEGTRWDLFCKLFKELMTKSINENYIAYTYVADMFIRLAVTSSNLYSVMIKEPDKYGYIKKWLKDQSYPANGYVYWYKIDKFKMEVKDIPSDDKTLFKNYTKKRLDILKEFEVKTGPNKQILDLAKNGKLFQQSVNMMDCDYSEENCCLAEFDIKIKGKWIRGTVKESADEMLHFTYQPEGEKVQDKWIKIGSDKLAPGGAYTKCEAGIIYERMLTLAGINVAPSQNNK